MKPSQGQLPSCPVARRPAPITVSKIDDVYFRTATVYRTLEPFWGEEYTLHVPNEFQAVSVHVFDHDLMGYVM